MTTISSVQVPELLQALIDSRLDTIDRMLLGRLPRAERLEVVREVESQIFELLQERCSDEPTREDVLAVLARLDPPEAYLPEELGIGDAGPAACLRSATRGPPSPGSNRPAETLRRTALASGIVGIASIVLWVLIFPLILGIANLNIGDAILVVWYLLTGITFIGSVLAISLAVYSRLQGNWAITGLVTGILALLGSLGFAVFGLFL